MKFTLDRTGRDKFNRSWFLIPTVAVQQRRDDAYYSKDKFYGNEVDFIFLNYIFRVRW